MENLVKIAEGVLVSCLAVKPGEEVLIAIDPQTDMRMANAMAAAALMCGAEYNVSMMPIRGKDKATIFPKTLELAMEACDVFVGMTTASGAAIYNTPVAERGGVPLLLLPVDGIRSRYLQQPLKRAYE